VNVKIRSSFGAHKIIKKLICLIEGNVGKYTESHINFAKKMESLIKNKDIYGLCLGIL